MTLSTAGLVVIQNRRLLLAYSRNKQCFYLPGGKINEDETAVSALLREIEEELNVELKENDLQFYAHITAPAFAEQEGVTMEQDCFLFDGNLTAEPSAEISEVRYFSLDEYLSEPRRAPGAVIILEKLRTGGLID